MADKSTKGHNYLIFWVSWDFEGSHGGTGGIVSINDVLNVIISNADVYVIKISALGAAGSGSTIVFFICLIYYYGLLCTV